MARSLTGALLGLGLSVTACSGNSCFVGGTRILTPGGRRNIEDLAVGDEVISFDIHARCFVTRRVARSLRAFVREIFRVEAGESVLAGVTAEHPFFNARTGDWVRTEELTVRSLLLATNGAGEAIPTPLRAIGRLPDRGEVEVWNLSIEGEEQNYFAENLLVHNKSPIDTGGYGGQGGGSPECPTAEPEGEACGSDGLSCSYGMECCCGDCYASRQCECIGGSWSCYYTDACFAPGCGSGGMGGMGGSGGGGGATTCVPTCGLVGGQCMNDTCVVPKNTLVTAVREQLFSSPGGETSGAGTNLSYIAAGMGLAPATVLGSSGPCSVLQFASGSMPPSFDVGTATVQGPNLPATMLDPPSYNATFMSPDVFAPGDILQVTVTGGPQLPAFSAQAIAPEELSVVVPAVKASEPFVLSWSPGVPPTDVTLGVGTGTAIVYCQPTDPDSLEIPVSLLSLLDPPTAGSNAVVTIARYVSELQSIDATSQSVFLITKLEIAQTTYEP